VQDTQTILPIGTVVRERYQVEEILGKGGFGAVYLVRDMRVHGNRFALKELVDTSKKERVRFAFECEVLKRLDHPSLPRVYRVFEDDANSRAYMLMDYIEGSNLEKLRRKQSEKRFSVPQALQIMAPVISAVAYLHSQRPPIIHRDIKPANIIMPSIDDRAMLVDFGIAKEYDPESTTTAIRRCSPGYGAPEQYMKGTNTRTDIYGLGATIYTLLTGVVPADAFYRMTQIGGHGVDPLEPATHYASSIPRSVSDVIQRAMSINASDRYPTVEEFWQALQNTQGEQPVAAPLLTPVPTPLTPPPSHRIAEETTAPFSAHPTKTTRRSRRLLPLLILLLVILAIIAGVVGALLLPALYNHPTAKAPASTPAVHHHTVAAVTPTAKPTSAPTAAPTTAPTAAPSPQPRPIVTGTYNGQAHNTNANETASLTITFRQSQGNLSGYVTIGPPLLGSGPIINGFVRNNGYVQFTVQGYNGNAPLFFWGTVSSSGNAQGQYCSLDRTDHCNANAGGQGTWWADPANNGTSDVPSRHDPVI
jgi:eukaryotic-like serine/threonine-protein kinase